MITPASRRRRVIPRWRSVDDALDPAGASSPAARMSAVRDDIRRREQEWADAATPTRGMAFDLVSVAATSAELSPVAVEASRWLLRQGNVSGLAKSVINELLAPPRDQLAMEIANQLLDQDEIRQRIHALRVRTTEDARDALAWAERARMHTLIGQGDAAVEAMRRALLIAPDHRFMLRSAARLWIHLDDPERAHSLLVHSRRTPGDPWLLASEIAVSSMTDRASRLLKAARVLLERRQWSLRDVTELASAVGTVELESGRSKRARDLFRLSLGDPNDNSLAQAEWAAPSLRGDPEDLRSALQDTARSFEARAHAAAGEGRHSEAVEQGWLWLLDQPFSSEAATFGSYQAALARDFERSYEFARRGLQANPNLPVLLNNAAFALAKLNRPSDASDHIERVDVRSLPAEEQVVFRATEGLIAFRSGDFARGQQLYLAAISASTDPMKRILAQLMYATEMLRLHLPGFEGLVDAVVDEAQSKLPEPDRAWLEHLRD